MMKMSGRVTSCCVALFFVLNSVFAVQKKLDSINNLKQINFGQSVPKHSLLLLHWFASTVDIDENDVIRLAFDPNSRAYGSHYYGNFEEMLVPLHRGSGYQYYTIGSLNQETTMQLPSYVVHPPSGEYVGTNTDRIIIRAMEQNIGGQALQRIDQVYITQHIENQGEYDPDQTYRITTNLLRQIRQFSEGQNQQQLLQLRNRYGSNADELQLRHIRNTWGDLACLGLLLFIVIQERYSSNQQNNRPQNNYTPQNNRPQTNYTPQNNRPQTNYTPQYRPQTNYTPQYRPQTNYSPQNDYRPGNIQNNADDEALATCICFLFLFIFVVFCLFIRAFFKKLGI